MNKRQTLWRRLGLRGRLLVLLAPVLILAGAALHALQLQREVVEYRADLVHETESIMGLLEASLVEAVVVGDFATVGQIVRRIKSPLIARIEWRDRSSASVAASGQAPERVAPALFRRHFGIPPITQERALELGGVTYGQIRVEFSGALLENRLWRETRNQLWQYGLELVLLVLTLSVFLARWLRPLETVNAVGQRFMGGDFAARVAGSQRFAPEMRAMAEMLNQVMAQVGGLVLSLSEQRRAIDDAVIVIESDLQGVIISVNDKFCEASGYSREEVIGRDHRFLNSGHHPRSFFEDMWTTIGRGETWRGEICNRSKSGGVLWLLTTITPVLGADGKPFKYISVRVNITRRKLAENVLAQQAQIIDQTHDAVFSTDLKGTLVSWNRGAELLFGYSAHESIGQPVRFIAPPEGENGFHATVFLALARDNGGTLETRLRKKSGEIFPAHFSLTLLKDENGLDIGVAGYVLDITERKQIENALREREASLAFAQRVAHMGSWEWDLESGQIQWSDEVYRIWGFVPGMFSPSYEIFIGSIHPDDRELVEKFITAALRNEVVYSIDHRIVLPDGSTRFVHEEAQVFRNEADKVVSVVGTVQDISERKQTEQEIRESREQLRELSNHLQTVREEEKASIAREIHDELGGNLTALKMDVFWLARRLPAELEAAREKVSSMSDLVDASVHVMRRIVTELRPTVLDDLGLLAAMQWQASEFAKRYNIQCKVAMHGEEIELTEELRITLFRIFQEALTNVARYSKASQVLVDMWREHDKIALEVFDNGIGIPEGAIMQPTSHGLRGMVERARSLGGSVEIGSAPGEGVSISVRIPLAMEGTAA